jgi:hypothetical protein
MAAYDSLTQKQKAFVRATLEVGTYTKAAEVCDVGETSVYRWFREDSNFRRALAEVQSAVLSEAVGVLAKEALESVRVLTVVRDDKEASAAARARACDLLLRHCAGLMQLTNFEERLQMVEEQIMVLVDK